MTQQLQPKLYPKVDDEATIVLAYPAAQGIIQASWNWPFGRKDTYVYGERGYVYALDSRRVRTRRGDAEKETEAPDLPAPEHDPFHYFAAVVRGERVPAPTDSRRSRAERRRDGDPRRRARVGAHGRTVTLGR